METDTSSSASEVQPDAQARAAAAVRPLRIAALFVNHTKKTCAVACFLPLLAIVLIVLTGAFTLDDPVGSAYFVRNDVRTELENARSAARRDNPFEGLDPAGAKPPATQEISSDSLGLYVMLRGKLPSGRTATVGNFDGAENVLTPDVIALHKQAEDAFLTHANYSSFCFLNPDFADCDGQPACALPESYLNHRLLYGRYTDSSSDGRLCGRRAGNEPVSQENFDGFVEDVLGTDAEYNAVYFDSNLTKARKTAWASFSFVQVGRPFDNTSGIDEESYLSWARARVQDVADLSSDGVEVYGVSDKLAGSVFDEVVLRDLSFAIVAIILVFVLVWAHTSSCFLAAAALAQIFLAFPLAFAVYHFVFRQLYFSALQILTVFLVLGVGADDVFVFTDAWKQAGVVLGPNVDLVTRMSYTYRRAVRAMTVTSFTTAAAFFVTASHPIMPISTLGVWAGLLILLLFALVITVYPCAVVVWHRFWRPRMFVRCFRLPETSATGGEDSVAEKDIAEAIEREANTPLWHRCLPKNMRPDMSARAGQLRPTERFFRGPWCSVVNRTRWPLIGLAIVLVSVSAWLATDLAPPTSVENFLPESHPIRRSFHTLQYGFPRSDAFYQLEVAVTWGIRTVDRAGTSKFDPEDDGTPVYDEEFDLTRAAVQQQMQRVCTAVNESDLLFKEDTGIDVMSCWPNDYATWAEKFQNRAAPFRDFDSEAELAADLVAFANFTHPDDGTQPYLRYLDKQQIVLTADRKRVVFTELRFVGVPEAEAPQRTMWPEYLKWRDEIDKLNNAGPVGGNAAIISGFGSFKAAVTQRTLVREMFKGIGVMLVVALVTLIIVTMNWVVAVLATLSIGSIICMLLGTVALLSWDLGIAESIGVVIGIGFSFDGVAHIATAYVESKSSTRLDRTRDALTDLGISVLFGALTTLIAALLLFPAIIIFFVKFAGLVVSTMILSLLWSLALFPALLVTFGPQNNAGSLKPLFSWVRIKKDKANKEVDKGGEMNEKEVGVEGVVRSETQGTQV